MCFFPSPNFNVTGAAFKKGVINFDCGACPECLRKRSNIWALRAVYEAKMHSYNCMITLTYDNYARDAQGRIVGELPPNRDLRVCKRDVQLFIKRLRKWQSSFSDEKIKYIACAEYGSHTHRAHYHCILFGVRFPDIFTYKKSKRGNSIYKSNILTSLWGHGICTVDSINVNSAVARYCTKYCAKTRSEDTFMLFSQRVGFASLLKDFNGISYIVEGREYPIPRFIWQHYIMSKYSSSYPQIDYRYLNRKYSEDGFCINESEFLKNVLSRSLYRAVRDSDFLYSSYCDYWTSCAKRFELLKLPLRDRILLLPDNKYHNYKVAALSCLSLREKNIPAIAPRSNCVSSYFRWKYKFRLDSCLSSSCPNMASDTKCYKELLQKGLINCVVGRQSPFDSPL